MNYNKTMMISLVIALLVLTSTMAMVAKSQNLDDFDGRVGSIIDDLSRLRSMGGNVSLLVDDVNRAIDLAEKGDVESAYRILDSVKANISAMEPVVEHDYRIHMVEKYALVAFLLILPVIVYFGLPRLYLSLWFRLRKRWIVEE